MNNHMNTNTINSQIYTNNEFVDTPNSYYSPGSYSAGLGHLQHPNQYQQQQQSQHQPSSTTPNSVPETPLEITDLAPNPNSITGLSNNTNNNNSSLGASSSSSFVNQMGQYASLNGTKTRGQKVLEEYRASKPPIAQHRGIDDELVMMATDPLSDIVNINANNMNSMNNITSGLDISGDMSTPTVIPELDVDNIMMSEDDFFKNYTSLHNGDDEEEDHDGNRVLQDTSPANLGVDFDDAIFGTKVMQQDNNQALGLGSNNYDFADANIGIGKGSNNSGNGVNGGAGGTGGTGLADDKNVDTTAAAALQFKDLDWLKFEM